MSTEAYAIHGAMVADLDRPLVVLQEGGYFVQARGENVRQWLSGAQSMAMTRTGETGS